MTQGDPFTTCLDLLDLLADEAPDDGLIVHTIVQTLSFLGYSVEVAYQTRGQGHGKTFLWMLEFADGRRLGIRGERDWEALLASINLDTSGVRWARSHEEPGFGFTLRDMERIRRMTARIEAHLERRAIEAGTQECGNDRHSARL